MLSSDAHRQVQAIDKAQRNARARDRRRRGLTPVLSWERGGWRRCILCGRWCSEAGTAGQGLGFRICEPCFVERELREEARRLVSTSVRRAA